MLWRISVGLIALFLFNTSSAQSNLFARLPLKVQIALAKGFAANSFVPRDNDDYAMVAKADSTGNIYVAGFTFGTFPGQTSNGHIDCFLRKYDSAGVEAWTVQIGTAGIDACTGLAIDSSDRPAIVGATNGAFPGFTNAGGFDIFITRRNPANGNESWLQQLGTASDDGALAASRDGANRFFVVGSTMGSWPGFTNAGSYDAFVMRFAANGTLNWTNQFGTSGRDEAMAVDFGNSRVFVAGFTNGTFSGQTSQGGFDAFTARYSAAGVQQWVRQNGTAGNELAFGLISTAAGVTHTVGSTTGSFSGFTNQGAEDTFMIQLAFNGNQNWLLQAGTSGMDIAYGVGVDSTANLYMCGYTQGSFPGFTLSGAGDGIILKYNSGGTLQWRRQFGTSKDDAINSCETSVADVTTAAGSTDGVFPGNISPGSDDDGFLATYTTTGTQTFVRQMGYN